MNRIHDILLLVFLTVIIFTFYSTNYASESKPYKSKYLENQIENSDTNYQSESQVIESLHIVEHITIYMILVGIIIIILIYHLLVSRKLKNFIGDKNQENLLQKELLKENDFKFRVVYDNASLGIFRTTISGKIIFANPTLIKMFGFDSFEDLTSRNVKQGYYNLKNRDTFVKIMQRDGEVIDYEAVYLKKDGRKIYVAESSFAVKNSDGEITSFDGIIQDISKRKNAEERVKQYVIKLQESRSLLLKHRNELTELNEKLLKSEKVTMDLNVQKNKFFSIIAHDLRGPFNSLLGIADYLNSNINDIDPSEFKKFIVSLNKSATKLYSLLENLLEWSRIKTGRVISKTNFELTELIYEIKDNFYENAKSKGLKLELEVLKDLSTFADRSMIFSVLRNLVLNSIKYTKPGGNIIIRAYEKNHIAHVEVQDNGIGIDPISQSKLFKIEKTINHEDDNNSGTGLGLILSKEFIIKNNGKIWVDSQLGKGSKFIFTIPLK